VEDRFQATTVVDLYEGNRVLIPAGSVMRGVISSVDKASRTDRKGSLTVAFDQVTVRGRDYPMRGTVTQALESEGIRGEVGRIGAGSAVGAIIGGILGGAKGAVLGVLIGGGGWWKDDGSKIDFVRCLSEASEQSAAAQKRWGRASLLMAQQLGAIDLHFLRRMLADHYTSNRDLLTGRKPMGLASSFVADLHKSDAPLIAWMAFGPPKVRSIFRSARRANCRRSSAKEHRRARVSSSAFRT